MYLIMRMTKAMRRKDTPYAKCLCAKLLLFGKQNSKFTLKTFQSSGLYVKSFIFVTSKGDSDAILCVLSCLWSHAVSAACCLQELVSRRNFIFLNTGNLASLSSMLDGYIYSMYHRTPMRILHKTLVHN